MSRFRACGELARLAAVLPLIAAALPGVGAAQTTINIRIMTEPANVRYLVDGQLYYAPSTFLWQQGSKHVVSIVTANSSAQGGNVCDTSAASSTLQYDGGCDTRYVFQGWETEKGRIAGFGSATQTFTVDGSFSLLKAVLGVEYKISVALSERVANSSTSSCAEKANNVSDLRRVGDSVGIVIIDNFCFDYSGSTWLQPREYPLQAMALNGFVFDGWLLNGARAGSIATLTVRGPTVIAPRFLRAKRIRIFTNPAELKVRVDRTEAVTVDPNTHIDYFPSPGSYDWLPGSKHLLGAPSPQLHPIIRGMWVFDKWSTGGGQDMEYTPDGETGTVTSITANFIRGVSVTFLTEPRGLRLKVDGRENWPNYQFVWGLGSKYSVSAPAEQVDSRGRKWTFKSWRHGGAAAQEVMIDQAAIDSGGVYYTAVYEALPQLTLRTSLPGQTIRIDGNPCASPCVLDRPAGTSIQISVPETIQANPLSRHDFTGWTDGARASRTVRFEQDTQELVAQYQAHNKLTTVVDPGEGANVIFDPESPDGFYPGHVAVTITIQAKTGFRFRRWEGDLSGTIAHGIVLMNAPKTILAMLTRVPQLSPASVMNAAGPTPVDGVAPGSLISIFGGSLASSYEAGPANPLAQTIGGVTAMVGDRFLPLIFVSPEQINALLPSDLEPGVHKLRVRPPGATEVTTDVAVVRHAPGLLSTTTDAGRIALAQRADGSAVTVERAAKQGEILTVLGTGFGPYDRPVVDGFAVPASPRYTLADAAELRLGDATLSPEWAGAAPGFTGLSAVRFRVPSGPAGLRELTVTVNGAGSNIVLLPLE